MVGRKEIAVALCPTECPEKKTNDWPPIAKKRRGERQSESKPAFDNRRSEGRGKQGPLTLRMKEKKKKQARGENGGESFIALEKEKKTRTPSCQAKKKKRGEGGKPTSGEEGRRKERIRTGLGPGTGKKA